MTDDDTTVTTTPTPRPPIRVPNVSPGAMSGLTYEVIGSDAQTAYDATQAAHEDAQGTDGTGVAPEVTGAPVVPDAGAEVPGAVEVQGIEAASDGPLGDAVNADTGEVTPGGSPLPAGADDTGETPLAPADAPPTPEPGADTENPATPIPEAPSPETSTQEGGTA